MGHLPCVKEEGLQCTTVGEVDEAVRGFWVDRVLRQHAGRDEVTCWQHFEQSEFATFVPQVEWMHLAWTGAQVREILAGFREGAAPGLPGVPIAVWKVLPEVWMDAVARLF